MPLNARIANWNELNWNNNKDQKVCDHITELRVRVAATANSHNNMNQSEEISDRLLVVVWLWISPYNYKLQYCFSRSGIQCKIVDGNQYTLCCRQDKNMFNVHHLSRDNIVDDFEFHLCPILYSEHMEKHRCASWRRVHAVGVDIWMPEVSAACSCSCTLYI